MLLRCEACRFESASPIADLTDAFLFEEETMDYHDGPLGGWMRCRRCEQVFAFDCEEVVSDQVWHWTLVPVVDTTPSAADVIVGASKARQGEWVSVLEDRRAGRSRCDGALLQNARVRPVSKIIRE